MISIINWFQLINEVTINNNRLYAIIWTIIGIWCTIHLTNRQNRLKKQLLKTGIFDEQNDTDIDIDDKLITNFAIKQRYIQLMIVTLTLIMAWSWRAAIDSFVLAMYGGNKLTTAHIWTYCIVMTLTISFLVSLSEHFYCLYPKEAEVQSKFLKSRTVKETSDLIAANCRFVVAFAWYDSIRLTVYNGSTDNVVLNVFLLYWSIAFLMVFLSIYLTNKYNQRKIKDKINSIGIYQWIKYTKKSLKNVVAVIHRDDDNQNEHNGNNENNQSHNGDEQELTYTQYEIPRICETFGVTIITLTINCWSTSGALFIADAVKYTILAIYFNVSAYDIEMGYTRVTTALWLQWLVVFATLGLTALIMLYLRSIIKSFKSKRKLLTQQFLSLIHSAK